MPYASQQFEPTQKVLGDFSGGVVFDHPASKLQETQLSSVSNLQFLKNNIRVDTGYAKYRQAVQGTPQAEFQFIHTDGSLQTLLLTTKYLYLDNGAAWLFVSDGIFNASTGVAAIPAGQNQFPFTNVANLAVGDTVGIVLDDTTQLQTIVTAIAGTTVTTQDAVPAGRTALPGQPVTRPHLFNGALQFQPSGLVWPTTNVFYFTNGIDGVYKYDGSQTTAVAGWAGIIPRVLVAFHGFLLLMDTTEGGQRKPQRVRNSDQNNPEQPNGQLGGLVDLTDTEDFILTADTLGPWLIIYREASIMRRSYIGDPLQLFFDEYMVTGIGIFSQNSVADTGATHVIAGPDGIFRYSGGYDVEDVGGPIFDQLLGPQGIFNAAQANLVCCFYVSELDEVWLMVPTGSNTWLDSLYRLDQEHGAWWIRTFTQDQFVGFGFIEAVGGRSWQQATVAWNSDTTTWLSHSKQEFAPLTLLLALDSHSHIYDYTSSTDDGATIPWSFSSKDFTSPGHKLRIDGIYAKAVGNNILVELSFDEGNSWINYGTLNFGLTPTTQQLNDQYSGLDVCRFRLSGSDPLFSLDWIRLDYFEETYW